MSIAKVILSFLVCFFLSSCLQTENSNSQDASLYGTPTTGGEITLYSQVQEVFIASCSGSGCHSFQSLSETELISSGRVVVGDPLNSSIYYRLIGSEGSGIKNMPLTGGSLTDDELDLIYTWIQEM